MDGHNPYEAPLSPLQVVPRVERSERLRILRFCVLWTFAFAVNLIVPLLLGLSLVKDHGRLGMMVAASLLLAMGYCICTSVRTLRAPLLLAMGYCICTSVRTLRAPLVAGSFLVALSQLFPTLQFVAGLVGLALAGAVGGVRGPRNDWETESIGSEFGGFVITLVTGGVLIVAALACGAILRVVTPSRWWNRSTQTEDS